MNNVKKQLGGKGFENNPQNINRAGRPEAELTYAELIRKVGEQKSKYNKLKTRKLNAVEMQWDKAEKGDLSSFTALIDRIEGRPTQAGTLDLTSKGEKIQGVVVEFVNVKAQNSDTGSV